MTRVEPRSPTRLRAAGLVLAVLSVASLAGCATAPPPPPPPPPAPVQILSPPRPLPPPGANANFVVPPRAFNGVRQTVNTAITSSQTTWNVRSALNVAALSCQGPQYEPLVANYATFLTRFRRELSSAQTQINREFTAQYGREGRPAVDAYLTKVYNYFSLPPVHDAFCDRALALSGQVVAIAPAELNAFTAQALPSIETVFEEFFQSFERYQQELAAWEVKYGVNPPLDANALQQAIAAATPAPPAPQPLPTAGPILR